MKTINQAVHDFWFEPAPAARLAILRILVGAFVVWYLTMEQDIFFRVARSTDPRLFAPVGVVFGSPLDPGVFEWLYRATLLVALLLHPGSGASHHGQALWRSRALGALLPGFVVDDFSFDEPGRLARHRAGNVCREV